MTDPVEMETVDLDQFEKKSLQRMNQLRQENLLCDVRFNVNGTIIPCHRLVLAATSPYFSTMFNGNFKESNSDTVTMKDIEPETFQEILNAMYTASIGFRTNNAYFILRASHLLQLEIIENACVSYIMKNPKINYLVDTCVFARNTNQDELYSKCILTIANDIVEYGKTDAFGTTPIDVFENILSKVNFAKVEEESITLLIMKWGKKNSASRKDIQMLLDATNLKTTTLLNSSVMSQLLVTCDDKPMNESVSRLTQELDCNDSDLPLSLYLNAIDVKTGERGWSVIKTNADLDEYVLSSFHPTNSRRKKVCRVGKKLYCFEYFEYMKYKNVFSYYDEDNTRISLPTPELLIREFEMAAMGTSIYIMEKTSNSDFSVWLYDCELDTWINIVKKNENEFIYFSVSACTFSDGIFYIIARKTRNKTTRSYIFSINSRTLIVEQLAKLPPSSCTYSSLCVFDSTAVVSDCCHNTGIHDMCVILDLDDDWVFDSKKISGRRADVRFFHYNNFVYVVENGRAMVPNEKYDLSLDEWIDLPHLPKKITISNTNDVVAIGEVFGIEVNP